MESSDEAPPRHYRTGQLTAKQATTVAAWRKRLQLDRPLPGLRKKGEVLRLMGIDDRPPASCSDVIASVVQDFLDQHPPAELKIASYVERAVTATKLTGQGVLVSEHAQTSKSISFYLPAPLADRYDALGGGVERAVQVLLMELREQAQEMYPRGDQAPARRLWFKTELDRRGLSERPPRVTGGVLARMAIDAAARRSVDKLLLAAVEYAKDVHVQPHRARFDMHKLGPS